MPYYSKVVGWLDCDSESGDTLKAWISNLRDLYERGETSVNPYRWSLTQSMHSIYAFFGDEMKYACITDFKKQISLLFPKISVGGFFYLQPIDGDAATSISISKNVISDTDTAIEFLYDNFLGDDVE